MASTAALDAAREAYARRAWGEAHGLFSAANAEKVLAADDVEMFAMAAHLIGREIESREILAQGYHESVRAHDERRAARFAFWIGYGLLFTGDLGQAGGWLARARKSIAEPGLDCVEHGYLLVPAGIQQLEDGDARAACETFGEAQARGARFGEVELVAMAGHGRGRALIRLGMVAEGMSALDEVMVAVTGGEVSPRMVGEVYCGVLEACHEVLDLRRAREWTAALSRWCEGQPDLVPYRGPCMVHRVELLQLHGAWEDAIEEAQRACEWLALPASPEGPGDAHYQLAELHRLRGDFARAEEAYRQASRLGRQPEPGLSLLWLARGRAEAARAAIRRCLDEAGRDRAKRSELLDACVEILLELGDAAGARAAMVELVDIAGVLDALVLEAIARRAEGRVLIAEGEAGSALAPLRRSWTAWQKLEAPYEAARNRVLIGIAYRQLGDDESAAMEFDAARWVFEELGAAPAVRQLDALWPALPETEASGGLTAREVEVLRLVAAGKTNKEIAAALVISEHTVARHVQNMLSKLGFSSRTSLAAFAVERGLAGPRDSQF